MTKPKVKICGITTADTAQVAIDAGADYLGFILDFPESPRYLTVDKASALLGDLRNRNQSLPQLVGVFVHSSLEEILTLTTALQLDVVQLHDAALFDYAPRLQKSSAEVWKVWRLLQEPTPNECTSMTTDTDLILLDANVQGRAGGGYGERFPWVWTRPLQKNNIPFGLAGGLSPDNIQDCLRQTHPVLVDVSSGVESAPGIKSPDLIRRFVANAQSDLSISKEL